jgi:muramoyltetrapeptide carboxypeptidase
MLTHLRNCGILQRLSGVAVGQFSEPAGAAGSVSLTDVLNERLGDLGIPVLGGLSIGHGDPNIAVPLGTLATLDADAGTLVVAPACS